MKKKYWYRTHYHECPVCGRGKPYRERVYGRKPKLIRLRHIYEQHWCGCGY